MSLFVRWAMFTFVCSLCGCRCDSDVLAKFDGGTITRSGYAAWSREPQNAEKIRVWAGPRSSGVLQEFMLPKQVVSKYKNIQLKNVERMLFQSMLVFDARKNGFDRKDGVPVLLELEAERAAAAWISRRIRDDSSFKEALVRLRLIYFRVDDYQMVKGPKAGMIKQKRPEYAVKADYQKAREKARAVIQLLEGGRDFTELAIEHSALYPRRLKGDVGYHAITLLPQSIANSVSALRTRQYAREPVLVLPDAENRTNAGRMRPDLGMQFDPGVYIVRLEDRFEATGDTIADKVPERARADFLRHALSRSSAEGFIGNLEQETDCRFDLDAINASDDQAIVFRVGKRRYHKGENDKRYAVFVKALARQSPKALVPDKSTFARDRFRAAVLSRYASSCGMDREDAYRETIMHATDGLLYRLYLDELTGNSFNLGEVALDFSSINRDVASALNELRDRMMRKYNGAVFESRL